MSATKKIAINGIGIALFVVLSLCLQVPVFENYYLCLGYIVMAVYSYSVGVFSGILVGTLGVVLYCLLINGLRGMPGWVIGNIVIGVIAGCAFRYTKNVQNSWIKRIICVAAVIVSTAIGILVIKSSVEVFLYAQPFVLRIANNIYAFVADIVVLTLAMPLCEILDPRVQEIIK